MDHINFQSPKCDYFSTAVHKNSYCRYDPQICALKEWLAKVTENSNISCDIIYIQY